MTVTLSGTPALETGRLILRAPCAADWPPSAAFLASERARFVGGPVAARAAWRIFGHVVGHWALRGFGLFVFCDKATGQALGTAGPWFPEGWPEPEIGWTLWRAGDEGRGLAFEAAQAALAHAFRDLGWQTAVSYIDAANARSIALAERLGARRDEAAAGPDPSDLVYRHRDTGAGHLSADAGAA